jgi:hypothetical protein
VPIAWKTRNFLAREVAPTAGNAILADASAKLDTLAKLAKLRSSNARTIAWVVANVFEDGVCAK